MKIRTMKKMLAFTFSLALFATVFASVASAAMNPDTKHNNRYFSFTMPASKNIGYSSDNHKRTNSDVNVAWYVDFTASSEGATSIAGFRLTKYSGKAAAAPGFFEIYRGMKLWAPANSAAYGNNCCLGVRNNNNVATSYVVTGYWDEETNTLLPANTWYHS